MAVAVAEVLAGAGAVAGVKYMGKNENLNKLIVAKNHLLMLNPFLAAALFRLDFIPLNTIQTAATNGSKIFYNENYIDSLSNQETVFLLAHETLHCLLLHFIRNGDRNNFKFNYAADAAINRILREMNFTVPKNAVPPWPEDKTAEEIYKLLPDDTKISCDLQDLIDGSEKLTPEQERKVSQDWTDYVKTATCPTAMRKHIVSAHDHKINWRAALREYLFTALNENFLKTWNKISRRIPNMQGRKRLPSPRLGIVIDTSGSIDHKLLGLFLKEVEACVEQTGAHRFIICADDEVRNVVEPNEEFSSDYLIGGGGTDFRPAIISMEKYNLDFIIYFTDGEGVFPKETTIPIVWVGVGNYNVPLGQKLEIVL